MAMVTIIISDDDTLKCGFRSQAFTGEAVDTENPSKSHVMSTHIMNWLKQEEGVIPKNDPAPEVESDDNVVVEGDDV